MRAHPLIIGSGIVAIATAALAQHAPDRTTAQVFVFEEQTSAPPTPIAGVRLELHVDTPVVHQDEIPRFTVRVVNGSRQTIRVSPPLDGSYAGAREPHYRVEFLDATGMVVPQPLGAQGGRCGNTNPFVPAEDVVAIAPGGSLDLERHPRAFPFSDRVTASARAGSYRIRVRYSMGLREATPLAIVSNTASITIAPGAR